VNFVPIHLLNGEQAGLPLAPLSTPSSEVFIRQAPEMENAAQFVANER
jgi:hypothetical protein